MRRQPKGQRLPRAHLRCQHTPIVRCVASCGPIDTSSFTNSLTDGIRKAAGPGYRTGFAVYQAPSSPKPAAADPSAPAGPNPLSNVLRALDDYQIKRFDKTGARTALFSKTNPESVRVGDVIQVSLRRSAEPFSGVLLSIRRAGIETAILVRSQLTKIGTEMWYKIYSRNVTGIEIVQRRPKRARRARLTFMRQPKHDMGSVDQLVQAWRKNRNIMRTRSSSASKSAAAKTAKGKAGKK